MFSAEEDNQNGMEEMIIDAILKEFPSSTENNLTKNQNKFLEERDIKNNGLQPRNISICFIEEAPVVVKMGKDNTSFNFLRLMCCYLIIMLGTTLLRNSFFKEDIFLTAILLRVYVITYRCILYKVPILWLFYHEKAKDTCFKKLNRAVEKHRNSF